MDRPGRSEYIIQEVAGCGLFQVFMMLSIRILGKPGIMFANSFMSFGNYNPGWRCVDGNVTKSSSSSLSSSTSNISNGLFEAEFIKGNCSLFRSCRNVEFSPEISTLVSEWGLLCDKAWIPSIMISVQMVGILVGCTLSGYLADAFGRKTVLYGAIGSSVIWNLLSYFSTSWQMFAVVRFPTGVAIGFVFTVEYVYCSEFFTINWRGPLATLPTWSIIGFFFSIACMFLKDWRHVTALSVALSVLSLAPAVWVPESLRWLEIKQKTKRFEAASKMIVKMNGKTIPSLEGIEIESLSNNSRLENISQKKYNFKDLFRKGYTKNTLLLIVPYFSNSLIFYAITFGVKSFSGSFFLNLIIIKTIDAPFVVVGLLVLRFMSRKKGAIMFSVLSAACLLVAALLHKMTSGELRSTGVMVFATLGMLTVNGAWMVITAQMAEIYPTVVRGQASGWGNMIARIGGILAPFLIPNQENTVYICYIVMAILAFLIALAVTQLPETKGVKLKDTFDEEEDGRLEVASSGTGDGLLDQRVSLT